MFSSNIWRKRTLTEDGIIKINENQNSSKEFLLKIEPCIPKMKNIIREQLNVSKNSLSSTYYKRIIKKETNKFSRPRSLSSKITNSVQCTNISRVKRSNQDQEQKPDRINLDNRGLLAIPRIENQKNLKLLSLRHNFISTFHIPYVNNISSNDNEEHNIRKKILKPGVLHFFESNKDVSIQTMKNLKTVRPRNPLNCHRENFNRTNSFISLGKVQKRVRSLTTVSYGVNNLIEPLKNEHSSTLTLKESLEVNNNQSKLFYGNVFDSLIFLDLYDNRIEKILNLSGLKNLTTLLLGKNRIKDISGLSCLKKTLRVLDLHGNKIACVSNKVSHMQELRSLNLAGNQICQIYQNDFVGLIHLKELNLKRNKIKRINGLHHLCELERLWLCNNNIHKFEDITSINTVTSLTEVTIENNPISLTEDCIPLFVCSLPNLTFLSQIPITESLRKSAISWKSNKEEKNNANLIQKGKNNRSIRRQKIISASRKSWKEKISKLQDISSEDTSTIFTQDNYTKKYTFEIPAISKKQYQSLTDLRDENVELNEKFQIHISLLNTEPRLNSYNDFQEFNIQSTCNEVQVFEQLISPRTLDNNVSLNSLEPILLNRIEKQCTNTQKNNMINKSINSEKYITNQLGKISTIPFQHSIKTNSELSSSIIISSDISNSEKIVNSTINNLRMSSINRQTPVKYKTLITKQSLVSSSDVSHNNSVQRQSKDTLDAEKEQGGDYSMEIQGKYLNIYGQAALRFIEKDWNTQKANDVKTLNFSYINFNSIAKILSRIKFKFPNAENFVFRETNISSLGQLNALAELQGITSLIIDTEGNPIYLKKWRPFAIYRLLHWGLKTINGTEIENNEIEISKALYSELSYIVLYILPEILLQPLLTRLQLDDTYSISKLSAKEWFLKADDSLKSVICKEALQWKIIKKSKNDNLRLCLTQMIENTCDAVVKLKNLAKIWPNLLMEIIKKTLFDYCQLEIYLPNIVNNDIGLF